MAKARGFSVYSVLGSKNASEVDTLARAVPMGDSKEEHNLQSAELRITAH